MSSDLRGFINKLVETDEINVIDEQLHWDLEASAFTARSNQLGGPAVWIKNVKDYPDCSIAGGLLAGPGLFYFRNRRPWTRLAMALELTKTDRWEFFQNNLSELLDPSMQVRPIKVSTGPGKEIMDADRKVDLYKFPFPVVHSGDGGRYGSEQVIIVKDPDSGWEHWGRYPFMVKARRKIAVYAPPNSHLSNILGKYEKKGESMPFAIAIGPPPAVTAASYTEQPEGTDLVTMAGGLGQLPINVIQAERSSLLLPADSEIILEGVVNPRDRTEEGPYPTFSRFRPGSEQPAFSVTAVTHRKNPILPLTVETAPASDAINMTSIMHSVKLFSILKVYHRPVKWILCPSEQRMGMCVVSTPNIYNGFIYQLSTLIFTYTNLFDKMLVLDTDINAEDFCEIWTEMVNKASPMHDWYKSDDDGRVPENAKYDVPPGRGGTLHIDSTWDLLRSKEDIGMKIKWKYIYPENIRNRVTAS
ncbi:MAG: UbiD family decarboxylase, partial [Desulfatiglandales bacterium]|nr:UbiD family decarboxylase [Desulfatiglandales bacterium]